MSAPTHEDLDELERQLLMLAEQGDTMTVATVQEEFSCGHDDASKMLDVLRESGRAVEESPGRWRGPMADEIEIVAPARKGDRVVVSVPDPVQEESVRPPPMPSGIGMVGQIAAPPTPTVRLTMAIANALDAAALGQLVKAGIGEAEASNEAFVMEVLP